MSGGGQGAHTQPAQPLSCRKSNQGVRSQGGLYAHERKCTGAGWMHTDEGVQDVMKLKACAVKVFTLDIF